MAPLRILLLEDEQDDLELIRRTLDATGVAYTIRETRSEHSFKNALTTQDFDLILVDYSVPRFDGISALRLAARERPGVPVVIMSGVIGEDLMTETLKIGAADFLLKHDMAKLEQIVRRVAL